MNTALGAALASWRVEPWLLGALLVTGWIYLRGWRRLHRDLPERLPVWRLVAFQGGLAVFFLAVASPLDAFAGLLLQVHMLQHFLLMMVTPPLLWLGAPELPLLHGLPELVRKEGLGPFLSWPLLHRLRGFFTHPVVCWLSFALVTWLWHVPALYTTALLDPFWHEVEHACFFGASLLFWFPVIQPWPSVARFTRWAMVPYLFLASLQTTVFSALFVFTDRVLYPVYAAAPRIGGMSPLEDQRIAGAVMWVPGSFVLLATTMVLVARLLSPRLVRPGGSPARTASGRRERGVRHSVDVLKWPALGAFLRSRSARGIVQGTLLLLALGIVLDGFFGPSMSPMNLAGVLPWTYWRTFVVVGLLVAGNLFCFACPFVASRGLGRRLFGGDRAWPAALRSKWLAAALVAAYLWAYEVFSLWDSPLWTAWVVVGYFVAAFVIDGFFRGASFCKYVCPIGQFNFVGSLVSPLEVKATSSDVCSQCETHDCIRGREGLPGCELDLFLPTKVGNLDCTFCMDCVRACPHENIGLSPRVPAAELLVDRPRASFGRLHGRVDVAALALVLVLGAFANAAGMVGPVTSGLRSMSSVLGWESGWPVITLYLLFALAAVPLAFWAWAQGWARWTGLSHLGGSALFCGLALALVPLGMAMWADHFLLHFAAGMTTAVPVVQRAVADLGGSIGPPDWSFAHAMGRSGSGLRTFQILLLDAGLLASLYVGWRWVRPHTSHFAATVGTLAPWALFTSLLFATGVWILFQPMEMRGMVH